MTRWFRMYDEILDDPKVQKLPAEDFKAWVNLLCLASKNAGRLPPIADISFALRVTEDAVTTLLERLASGGLIEVRSGGVNGSHHAPHGWDKRQYKSDTSAERVKRYRQRNRNVTETADETPPEPETESETEQSPPYPPQSAGQAGRIDPSVLASDLCRIAGIAKPGIAATEHVRRWLGDGIGEATIRHVVTAMATNAGGTTRSLKRFDMPIRRAHDERPRNGGNGRSYEPHTVDELERAVAAGVEHGWDVTGYRRQLAALVADTAAAMRVSAQ